ncbi:hypothetical protein ZWY2020_005851 [Hordeum vulgare]|nr:hypothetical protein ZWY2020_005851 [Hordeum vulgare]
MAAEREQGRQEGAVGVGEGEEAVEQGVGRGERERQGLGYAMSTAEELRFVKNVAAATGIVLDPVYTGKAAYGMLKDMSSNPTKWEGRRVLFVHTGGLLGLYDKLDQLSSLAGGWRRMDLEEPLLHANLN